MTTVTERVGALSDFAPGTMRMAKVGDHRIAVVSTPSGIHAIDNACPHQGYGLTTGALESELVTCQWHNWKFDVRDGSCIKGEEDVACHQVQVRGNDVLVTVRKPTPDERREKLWPSLRRGIDRNYLGQIARDVVRLLDAGAKPAEIMAIGVAEGAARTEWGINHETAMAADCLALAEAATGTDRALPLVHGLSGIAETTRDRPVRQVPAGDPSIDLVQAIEDEDVDAAMASVVGQLEAGVSLEGLRRQFIHAASAHHLDFGHGMIYVQKVFELLERIGSSHAAALLPHLAAMLGWATREDLLPYMRSAMRLIDDADLDELAVSGATADSPAGSRQPISAQPVSGEIVDRLLDAPEAPIGLAIKMIERAGVGGLLDSITVAASQRLMRFDLRVEFNNETDFGWLGITHALTLSNAVRWAWSHEPGPETAKAALFAAWLLFDSGRAERRFGVSSPDDSPTVDHDVAASHRPSNAQLDLDAAIRHGHVDTALAWVRDADLDQASAALSRAALADQAGSFIVTAHLIKLSYAAAAEARTLATTSPEHTMTPLLGATRVLAAPRLERFVAAEVAAAVEFVQTGSPPKR